MGERFWKEEERFWHIKELFDTRGTLQIHVQLKHIVKDGCYQPSYDRIPARIIGYNSSLATCSQGCKLTNEERTNPGFGESGLCPKSGCNNRLVNMRFTVTCIKGSCTKVRPNSIYNVQVRHRRLSGRRLPN